jgi:acyl-CoA dehydrogenase
MTYSFTLSKPLAEYGRVLRDWSVAECRPYARQADTDHARPANWQAILDTAPIGLDRTDMPDAEPIPTFDEGYWVRSLVFYENINYGDTWVHPTLGGGIAHLVVNALGTQEQRDKWYIPVVERGLETGFALTEPQFGSDTSQVATTATRDGDTWVINGAKMYCTAGATAEFVLVFATVDKSLGAKGINAFVVPKGTPGFIVTKANEDKMGITSWVTSQLFFENCSVSLENRLGWSAEGEEPARTSGQAGALSALGDNRPNMSAMAIGLAQASLDVAAPLLHEQKAGFAPQRWAGIENDLDSMNRALQRGRRVNFKGQYLLDQGKSDRTAAAIGKGFSPQTCERVIRRCMQLLGPEGTSQELLLEKWYRDVKIMDIFEGSGQVQRIVVGRSLLGRLAG